jgi:hypothetical protein
VPDYSYQIATSGNVDVTFTPGSPITGCDFVIFYYRIGTTGNYAGYIMTASGGSFTSSVSIPSGSAIQLYFTYRRSAGGGESNSSATPHSYTVGTSCGARSAVHSAGVASAPELETELLEVYPNPTSGKIFLKVGTKANDRFRLIDQTGREINVRLLDDRSIDISSLPAGMYIIMNVNDRSKRARFIKK